MAEQFDLVVIGAGPGGYEAAIEASKKGLRTALVEEGHLGGTCLNRGCIPTKTMIHTAELYQELGDCGRIGLSVQGAGLDMEVLQGRKEEVLSQLRGGIATRLKSSKVSVFEGTGTIVEPHTVCVSGEEEVSLKADRILIATGSVPAVPPIPGSDRPNVITSDQLLDKKDMFENLVVIGGGVIGMEFASIYSAMGHPVTVIEALDRILPNMDKEIAQNLKMILKKRGVDIHTGARVEKICESGDGKLVCHYTEKDNGEQAAGDGVLICVGRKPNTGRLFGPGMEPSMERGRILVNENFQTSCSHIYAIGDVIGGVQLAHMATAEGLCAVSHLVGEAPVMDLNTVPGCVYTNPEIGVVGLSAEEAKLAGIKVVTGKYIMTANGKSILSLQERGFIKVVADAGSRKILGAQMMCARATDMISEFSTAIVNGLTVEQMASVIRPHPTFCEGIGEVLREPLK